MSGLICTACGLPSHRFGKNDPDHEYSPTACINGLLFELRVISEVALQLARRESDDLAVQIVAEAIHAEKERIYASNR